MNKVRKNKFIVSIILIIASVCAAGAFSVRIKADTSKKYDVEGMKRDTVINTDSYGNISFTRNKKSGESMGRKDTWTIMIYMDGSDLEMCYGNATKDLKEIMSARITSSRAENVNILVQTGGCSMWFNNYVDGTKTQRLKIDSIGCPSVVDEFEVKNMGEADTFYDFINWGVTNYPAEHMGVIFWNHGNGVSGGVCTDKNDSLMVPEMEYAFSKVSKNMSTKFDFIGFDTCLAGSLEYACAFAPYADYMIASANTEPGDGWNYQELFNVILDDHSTSMEKLGKVICDSYYDNLSKDGRNSRLTMAMYDLNKVDEVCIEFNKLAKFMYEKVAYSDEDYNRFNNMQTASERVTYGADKENMDLGSLMYYFETTTSYSYDVTGLKASLDEFIYYNRISPAYETYKAAGVSFYFPVKAMKMSEYAVVRNVLFSPYHFNFLEFMGYKRAGRGVNEANNWEKSECFYEKDFEFLNYYRDSKIDDGDLKQILSANIKYVEDGFVDRWMKNFGKSISSRSISEYNRYVLDENIMRLSTKDNMNWILPDGQDLTAYVEYSLGEILYSIPVVIKDTEMTIKIREKMVNDKREYELLGVWDSTINSDYEGRGNIPLEIGTVIIPIYDIYNEEKGIYESEYGQEYRITSEFDFLVKIK